MSRLADPRWLAALPPLVLLASYVELARYHGSWWLWGTVVHESGTLTLLETTLYASHFLGHVPVHVVLALLLAGSFAMVASGERRAPSSRGIGLLAAGVAALLAFSVALALAWFGDEDTLAYVLQQRQRAGSYDAGGSWALHLPSTQLQLGLIPLAAAAAAWVYAGRLRPGRAGGGLVGTAVAGILGVTWLVGGPALAVEVWTDPRYLAHSVREVATFPVLYYPVPLAVWLAAAERRRPRELPDRGALRVLALLAVLVAVGVGIQAWISLAVGIDTMSQRPAFAGGEPLGIPYLLASHYFEHVLDAAFFVLVALLADALRRRHAARRPDGRNPSRGVSRPRARRGRPVAAR